MLSTAFAITWKEIDSVWFHRLVTNRQKLLPTNHKLTGGSDKSFADDLVASRYCKHESSLCATICWDFSCVPTICSSHCVWRFHAPPWPLVKEGHFFLINFLFKNFYLEQSAVDIQYTHRSHFGSRYHHRLKRIRLPFWISLLPKICPTSRFLKFWQKSCHPGGVRPPPWRPGRRHSGLYMWGHVEWKK